MKFATIIQIKWYWNFHISYGKFRRFVCSSTVDFLIIIIIIRFVYRILIKHSDIWLDCLTTFKPSGYGICMHVLQHVQYTTLQQSCSCGPWVMRIFMQNTGKNHLDIYSNNEIGVSVWAKHITHHQSGTCKHCLWFGEFYWCKYYCANILAWQASSDIPLDGYSVGDDDTKFGHDLIEWLALTTTPKIDLNYLWENLLPRMCSISKRNKQHIVFSFSHVRIWLSIIPFQFPCNQFNQSQWLEFTTFICTICLFSLKTKPKSDMYFEMLVLPKIFGSRWFDLSWD